MESYKRKKNITHLLQAGSPTHPSYTPLRLAEPHTRKFLGLTFLAIPRQNSILEWMRFLVAEDLENCWRATQKCCFLWMGGSGYCRCTCNNPALFCAVLAHAQRYNNSSDVMLCVWTKKKENDLQLHFPNTPSSLQDLDKGSENVWLWFCMDMTVNHDCIWVDLVWIVINIDVSLGFFHNPFYLMMLHVWCENTNSTSP